MAKLVGRSATTSDAQINRTPRRPHTLVISVSHGDLRLASFPLAVGHYHGDTIVHAEDKLDRQLNGRLKELFNLYLYPGPPGTVEVVHMPTSKPPGGLIIGLGNVGEIRSSVVRDGICNATLRYALALLNDERNRKAASEMAALSENGARPAGSSKAQAASKADEADSPPWLAVGISTLLLGTYGGNSLSIAGSVSAIVQGVAQANEALRAQELWDKVRINKVEFVELYEDVAREAMRAAVYLAEHTPSYLAKGDALQVEPFHIRPLGDGRIQRPIDPYSRGWWRRIRISTEKARVERDGPKPVGEPDDEGQKGEERLRFLALTDRARAEDTLQYTQRGLIEKAIKEAIAAPGRTEELGAMLYDLIIPNSIKELASSETDVVFLLDSGSAKYPWELLAQRTRDGAVVPLAVKMGIIRQFVTENFVPNPQPAREPNALVIGVPKSKEVPLKGARDEAEEVAKILKEKNYRVGDGAAVDGPLLDATPLDVIRSLFARSYKILHLAGHGKYDPVNPAQSGMILDDGMMLSPIEIQKLPAVPELVFINCCYLGQLDGEPVLTTKDPHKMAASISEELIKMGVKAVVAAGWAVEDRAAAAFARTFYQHMMRGEKFGAAVEVARVAAYGSSGGSNNTWGAYQCYGNPDFVLETEGDGSEHAQFDSRCYSQREYLEKLSDFKSEATRADDKRMEVLRNQLEELVQKIPERWGEEDAAVLSAIGEAWAELGNFDKAIASYRQAAEKEKAEASLKTIEQLANMLSRYAEEMRLQQQQLDQAADSNGAHAKDYKLLTDEALRRLTWLFGLGETSERFSLMGGYYKRMALGVEKLKEPKGDPKRAEENYKKRTKAYLELAEENYKKAYERDLRVGGAVKPYATLNWLTCCFLLNKPPRSAQRLIRECQDAAVRAEQNEPAFFNRNTKADAELLLHLMGGTLAKNLNQVAEQYRRARGAGVTQRDLSSVAQYFSFVREMLTRLGGSSPSVQENIRALEKLNEVATQAS